MRCKTERRDEWSFIETDMVREDLVVTLLSIQGLVAHHRRGSAFVRDDQAMEFL
jgi:hypothetical protein